MNPDSPPPAASRFAPLRLFAPVASILVVSIGLVAGLILYAAHSQDRMALESSTRLARSALMHNSDRLGETALDYSWWDEFHQRVETDPDPAWLNELSVYYLVPEKRLDVVLIVGADDRILHYHAPGEAAAPKAEFLEALAPLIEAARDAPAGRPEPVSAYVGMTGSAFALVSASAATPTRPSAAELQPHPRGVLVVGRLLDASFLSTLAEDYALDEAAVVAAGTTTPAHALPLHDARGRVLAHLSWTAERPGRGLVATTLPVLASALVVMGGLFWLFLNRAHRLVRKAATGRAALERAKESAEAMNDALERHVGERTAELSDLNERLRQEVEERLRVEHSLRKRLDREKELSDLKSRFVAMASHEFRTPLTTIAAASDLLLHYSDRMSDAVRRKNLEEIASETRYMTDLLEDILTFERGQANRIEFSPRPCDIAAFCEDLVKKTRIHDAGKHRIEVSVAEKLRGALVDEKLLRQILANLLSNALKYSPPASRVRLAADEEGKDMVFKISDQGIGIPPEDREHLFEEFHRGTNASGVRGTGLGLAIAKKAADLHRGRIEFISAIGEGTTFTVRLPHRKAPDA